MNRRRAGQPKLIKKHCEICYFDKPEAINFHHIIPKRDPRCTNDNHNIAIVCHSCHDLIHAGKIIIIGVYSSTGGRKLMWFRQGEDPPLEEEFWMVKENPLVILRGKH
ncbi:MAG: HNH endonuclease [Proteobacteria bacterium]|nr:HNH endonuclease [Pseudomonadota bacterium]